MTVVAFVAFYGRTAGDVTDSEAWLIESVAFWFGNIPSASVLRLSVGLLECLAMGLLGIGFDRLIHRHTGFLLALAKPGLLFLISAAITASLWRIASVHFYMEWYQGFLISALVAGFTAWNLRQRPVPISCGTPLAIVVIAARIIYVHAWLPERDQWNSPRPLANAIAAALPKEAELFADNNPGPAFRFYLRRPIRLLEALTVEDDPSTPRFALLFSKSQTATVLNSFRLLEAGRFADGGGRIARLVTIKNLQLTQLPEVPSATISK